MSASLWRICAQEKFPLPFQMEIVPDVVTWQALKHIFNLVYKGKRRGTETLSDFDKLMYQNTM
jgi:hypothetical protein